jgi:hypothetical protein
MKHLNSRNKIIMAIKEFDIQKELSNDYKSRVELESLVPDIHQVLFSKETFEKIVMEISFIPKGETA